MLHRILLRSALENRRAETVVKLMHLHVFETEFFEEFLGSLSSPAGAQSPSVRTAVERHGHAVELGDGVNHGGRSVANVLAHCAVDADVENQR